MKTLNGKIKFYDTIRKEGLIEGENGNYYEFQTDTPKTSFITGLQVNFVPVVVQNIFLADYVEEA